jgi:hypothetical protein
MQLKLNNIGELKIGDELFFYNRERGVHKNYVRGFQRNEIEEADKKYFPVERFGRERVYLSFEKDGPFKDCRLVYLDHFETVVFTTQEEAEAYALKIILSFQSDELIRIDKLIKRLQCFIKEAEELKEKINKEACGKNFTMPWIHKSDDLTIKDQIIVIKIKLEIKGE